MATETTGFRRRWALLSAAAGDSDMYEIPTDYNQMAVTVQPGAGGSASLHTSCASPADIAAGNADWLAVEIGGATSFDGAEGASLSPAVTAVRLTATTAAATARLSMLDTDR